MLTVLLLPFRLILNFTFALITTALIGLAIIIIGLPKLLLPIPVVQRSISVAANALFRVWGYAMSALFRLTQPMRWHIEGDSLLHRDRWYMIIANHRSWVDILVLMHLACRNMPMPRFFLKQQLFWVPVVGLGCWTLDMPFMKRYSREQVAKNPKLKGKDIETTQRKCEKFRHIPTTVINFCEGTRFTADKHAHKHSPYQHLLPPKAGGTAFTLQIMGQQFDAILDITIVYPNDKRPAVWELLTGQLRDVYVHVETLPVTDDLIGDYFQDEAYKTHFQEWLNQRWQHKDKIIDGIRQRLAKPSK
ncbi:MULTISPECIES: acyltransferase [Pseudidiomarina]|uniref:1-acyl-sn-glycerol-3-phosphate acyltransferase n=3 Tax=Pseudidiomarina TaxID=2800384 RepID=A0A368UKK2_9GAMM|nr:MULTISPECIES: acyltransferase [Pseudidiomarina]PWW09230.1 1-acyl-sn-glycerol-3-phosphate acyltransferase [Pseudidiomarina maritima]RBP87076.1 1-acyl-sn-glycerol-3-phosphate acyltransferase [Pseudidiomarina tainanensis]RCW29237.1 1-acyl-sn-glycerol-3-phosphate acyltransferase [Pseudidiomarina tainanensis]